MIQLSELATGIVSESSKMAGREKKALDKVALPLTKCWSIL